MEQRPDGKGEPSATLREGLGLPYLHMLTVAPGLSTAQSLLSLSFTEVRLSVFLSSTLLCSHLSATPSNFVWVGKSDNQTYSEFSVLRGRVTKEFVYGGFAVSCIWVEESRFCAQGYVLEGGSVKSLLLNTVGHYVLRFLERMVNS